MSKQKLLEVHTFRRDEDNHKRCKETIFTNKKGLDLEILEPLIKKLSQKEDVNPIYYGYDFDLGDNKLDYGYVELGAVVPIDGSKYNLTMLSDNDDVIDLLYVIIEPDMTEECFWELSEDEIISLLRGIQGFNSLVIPNGN